MHHIDVHENTGYHTGLLHILFHVLPGTDCVSLGPLAVHTPRLPAIILDEYLEKSLLWLVDADAMYTSCYLIHWLSATVKVLRGMQT